MITKLWEQSPFLLFGILAVVLLSSGSTVQATKQSSFQVQESEHHQLPFMVHIQVGEENTCAGFLYKSDFVLCPAHCLQSRDENSFLQEQIVVTAGAKLIDGTLSTRQIRQAKRIYTHPEFSNETLGADVGLVQLSRPMKLNKPNTVFPAQVSSKQHIDKLNWQISKSDKLFEHQDPAQIQDPFRFYIAAWSSKSLSGAGRSFEQLYYREVSQFRRYFSFQRHPLVQSYDPNTQLCNGPFRFPSEESNCRRRSGVLFATTDVRATKDLNVLGLFQLDFDCLSNSVGLSTQIYSFSNWIDSIATTVDREFVYEKSQLPVPFCGNKVVEQGEVCDDGPGGSFCCHFDCTAQPLHTVCSNGPCFHFSTCDGLGACLPSQPLDNCN